LHRVWSLGVLLGATLAVHATTAAPQDSRSQPIFRSGTQAIEVDVRVTDRDGNAVRDLTRDDFVLLDDGVAQAITTATFVDFSVESPVSRMVPDGIEPDVVTNAGSGRMWVILLGGYGLRARDVARRFVETSMGPNDQVAIVPVFGTISSAQGFTGNPLQPDRAFNYKERAEIYEGMGQLAEAVTDYMAYMARTDQDTEEAQAIQHHLDSLRVLQ
jgi:VWFA-related protein